MKQKHQILVHGLRNNNIEETGRLSAQNGRIEEITFAHAKKDLQQNSLSRRPLIQPKTPPQSSLQSSSPRSSRQRLLKRSKILEYLDTSERKWVQVIMLPHAEHLISHWLEDDNATYSS